MGNSNKAYLLIGGNQGDRIDFLAKARAEIANVCGRVVQHSSLYETAAWGFTEQAPFLNQALFVHTALDAHSLLRSLLQIEEGLGRMRELRYGPRSIDLDILFFNEDVIAEKELTIPHPQVQNRRFALVPMAEIAPQLLHPVLQKTIAELLQDCPDLLDVHKIS